MKIESVHAIPVSVPRSKPMSSASSDRPLVVSEFGIVKIFASGVLGLGEISMNFERSGAAQCEDVNRVLAPMLIGRDAEDIRHAVIAMNQSLTGSEPAKAGIEMALFDVVGRGLGVPVYQLLGGRVRNAVPVRWGLGFGDPQAAVEEAQAWVQRGFKTIKIKVGRPGTGLDAKMVEAVRTGLGDSVKIMVDANGGYSTPGEAVHELARLTTFNLQLIEQPLPGRQLWGMADVRRRLGVPILADESVRHPSDAYSVAVAGAADALSIYVSEMGGLISAASAFAVAEAAGLPCTLGSQCELGIGTAAMAHLAVAMPNLAYESDITGHLRYPSDVICERLTYVDGAIQAPSGPGLGVTLDEDAIERWRIDR